MPEEGGALCLLCLAAGSGLPLFCRTRGGPPRPQLPFSLIGSLHAVHVFGAGAGAALRGAATPTTRLAWGGYGQSITLIALSSAPGPALSRLLDSAFSAMVLVLGLDELVPIRNVERLKRELRVGGGLPVTGWAVSSRNGRTSGVSGGLPVAGDGFIRVFGQFRVLGTMFHVGIGGPLKSVEGLPVIEMKAHGGLGGLPGPMEDFRP
ncbi:protein fuzzy homolog [Grus americana]|uniref:protein fuzzy homolog n=1 Tax=Grus americana TaxID=9117 RepID=UPI002407B569|nr:protein fuzzy homolog [Grus americana]